MRKDQLIRALLQPVAKRAAPISRSPAKKSVSPTRNAVGKNGTPNSSAAIRNGSLRNGSLRNGSAKIGSQNRNGTNHVVRSPVASTSIRPTPPKPVRRAPVDPRLARRLEQAKLRSNRAKSISTEQLDGREGVPVKDRLVVMVRGPYWLHAYWELTPAGIIRAQAALGEQWHSAKPMLRLVHVSSPGGSTSAERVLRDIAIHGGVKNWYVDVLDPPQTYRMEIGYLAANGRFFSLARSNTVTTPASGSSEKLDQHWTDVVENCDTIYAMSGGYSTESNSSELQEVLQDRLRRRVGGSLSDRYQAGVESLLPKDRTVRFHVEAEMLVHGTTHPDAQVTLQGAPIKLRADGSFSVRLDLPNRRQVLPLVATSKDGASQRTVVLAVERNTKTMEPLNREPNLD
jgi:hypothetical protein